MDQQILDDIEAHTGDGWYGLGTDEGWYKIVADLHLALKRIDPNYVIYQIKSKFGGLRYYSSLDGNAEAQVLVRRAEELAYNTCEICGSDDDTVTLRGSFYTSTLCSACADGLSSIQIADI